MRGSIVCRQCGKGLPQCKCRGERSLAVVLYLGKDPETGKKKQQWVGGFRNVKEAQAHLLKVAASPAYGSGLGPNGSTKQRFGTEMARWIERSKVSEKEKASRRCRFNIHVEPKMGGAPLSRILPATIQDMLDGLAGINGSTQLKVFKDVRMFLDYSMRMGWTNSNPCDTIDPPTKSRYRSPTKNWSDEHVDLFARACETGGDLGLLFLTACYMGSRQGEVLGLPWTHVEARDHLKPRLVVVQDLERPRGGGARIGETKTENSERTVVISPWMAQRLRDLRKRQTEERLRRGLCEVGHECRNPRCQHWHDWNLVFTQPNGKPLHGHNITQRDLKALCKVAGVPEIRFHDLKHLHNSLLMRENVNLSIIKQRAGHSSVSMSDKYSWASINHEEQQVAVEALDRAFEFARD